MTQRLWTDATGNHNAASALNWSPAGRPVSGDILGQNSGQMNVSGTTLAGAPLYLGTPQTGLSITPAQLNLSDNAAVGVVVGPSPFDTQLGTNGLNHYANITVQGSDALALFGNQTSASNATAIGLAPNATLTATIVLSGNDALAISGDSTSSLADTSVTLNDGATANITNHSLGTDKYVLGFDSTMTMGGPVDAGAGVSLLANNGAELFLADPRHFTGTVNFVDGSTGTGTSLITLAGTSADSYTFSNNELSLYSAGNVAYTLNLLAAPGGFGVYSVSGGVVVSSSTHLTSSSLHALPVHL